MVSANSYIWFGIPGSSMQWVPAPQAQFQRNWSGNVQTLALEDGRQLINSSPQKHSQFVGNYFGRYDDPNGINLDVFADYASGYYGSGPIVFANPYAFTRNMFAPNWASPMLIQQGWGSFGYGLPTYSTVSSSLGRPKTAATFTIPSNQVAYTPWSGANKYNQYIAIPPNMTLYVGASGTSTGTAYVFIQPYNASDNSLGPLLNLALLSPTAATQVNATFSGATYNAVRVFIGAQSSVASTITLTNMMARLYPTGSSPSLAFNHVPGQGNSGLAIVGSALSEVYLYNGISKSLSLTLEEVI
jgi:hypothetical protein